MEGSPPLSDSLVITMANCQGLLGSEYRASLLAPSHLFCLTETWHTPLHNELLAIHGPHATDSLYNAPRGLRPRADSGLLCLSNTTINVIHKGHYHVLFQHGDSPFPIFLVYLPPSMSADDVMVILNHTPSSNVLVIGDFNVIAGGRARRSLVEEWATTQGLDWHHFHGETNDIVFTRGIDVESIRIIDAIGPSDHEHVMLTITTPRGTHQTTARPHNTPNGNVRVLAKDSIVRDMFQKAAHHLSRKLITIDLDVDTLDLAITSLITEAANTLTRRRQSRPVDAGIAVRRADSHKGVAIAFRRLLERSTTTIVSSRTHVPVDEDAATFWGSIYADPSVAYHGPEQCPCPIDIPLDDCWEPVGIREAVMEYPTQAAGCSDGVTIRHLRLLLGTEGSMPTAFEKLLSKLFRTIARTHHVPMSWKHSDIRLLPKTTGATCTPQQTRPISLTAMLRRIFEKLLLQKIGQVIDRELHPGQGGFRGGYSTITHILTLANIMTRSGYIVFLDIKKAYDKADLGALNSRVRRTFGPSNTKLLMALFQGTSSSIGSHRFDRHCGVFQGSLLSPSLFNLLLDDALRTLQCDQDGPLMQRGALGYADDVVAYGSSLAEITRRIHCFERALERIGLELNAAKCGILCTVKRRAANVSIRLISGQQIHSVTQYTYLGLPFTSKGANLDALTDSLVARATAAIIPLKRMQLRPAAGMAIYKSHVRSRMEYGIQLLHLAKRRDLLDRLQQLQQEAMATVTGIAKPPPRVIMGLGCLPTMHQRADEMSLYLTAHLDSCHPQNPIRRVWADRRSWAFAARQHRLKDAYWEWKRQGKPEDNLSMQTFMRIHWLSGVIDLPLTMAADHHARNGVGVIKELCFTKKTRHLPISTLRLFLRWRFNRFRVAKCSLCHEAIDLMKTRAHFKDCCVMVGLGSTMDNILNEGKYALADTLLRSLCEERV